MTTSRKQNLIFITLFFAIIFLPGLFTILNNKNGSLYSKIAYLKENFAGKDYILAEYNFFKLYKLQEDPVPDKVISGKDNWFFLGDYYEKGHSKSLGLIKYNQEEIAHFAKIINRRKEFLEKRGIKFYAAIAPNKQSIYDEFLLEGKYDPSNGFQLLKKYLKNNYSFNLLDLKEDLEPLKDSIPLYYKTDTHWNGIGGFIAFNQIIKYIKQDFNNLQPYNFKDYEIIKKPVDEMDLTSILKLKMIENEITLKPKFEKTYLEEKTKYEVPFNFSMSKSSYEIRSKNVKKKLKILVFRDSFTTALVDYFKQNFGNTLLLWDFKFDENIIINEKPDIVLYLVAERFIDKAFAN